MIRTKGLTKRFGKLTALDGVELEVPAQSIFALAGPNGAGKSTLLHILMNHLRADAGAAEVFGVDSRRLAPAHFERMGYVAESRPLPLWMRVSEFFAYTKSFYPAWREEELEALVKQFALPLDRKLGALSRGQRMQAALAAVLAYRPELILLDEPFGGLDVFVREQVIESILERSAESTVVLASHDLAEIESFATHFAYLSAGRLRFAGEIQALQERFREVEVLGGEDPVAVPDSWLNRLRSGPLTRFTDSRFEGETAIRERFPHATRIETRPLPLRSIFVELAKAERRTER